MNFVLELNHKMFEFMLVSRRFEAADNDGGDVLADSISGRISEQSEGFEYLGVTVAGCQHLGDDG